MPTRPLRVLVDMNIQRAPDSRPFRDQLASLLPGHEVFALQDDFPEHAIEALATAHLRPGLARRLPALRLVQKLGAGVDTMVRDPDLAPGVRITRLRHDGQAQDMAEWALSHVLALHRDHAWYASLQAAREWSGRTARPAPLTTVAVLGLGEIGGRVARAFAAVGFRVIGWSRSSRAVEGVETRSGPAALDPLLGEADYVIAVLPSTAETSGLFGAARLAGMKDGATLLNMGRGDLVDEAALPEALDAGRPARAVLDVTRIEPLPPESPLWAHPAVTLTPHVSGRNTGDAMAATAENFRRLAEGLPLLDEVDRTRGY
ncbi:glyoxylate/hydroxypyruvate reductase A [Albimonas donghaensis]|uniref:Glyoxylate/hydroxypyruvate reductase A n=1 Tax=Albimonas donghaensis TaxID=356660 RepID=A0A1H3C1P0_9RHOB|nr:glyoxylate/hydroxypyruvate reductase A [Albimonas donghaensis]SDX47419.1 glyoxylate/hydroxypyruvate reductase A [Albimonas donghaensis]